MKWVINSFSPAFLRGLQFFFIFVMLSSLSAQTAPDLVYSQGSGSWSTSNLWNTQPDGSGEYILNPSDPAISVVIQAGHAVTLPGARQVQNLHILPGGSLASGLALNRYIEIYGSSVQIDGLAGGVGDGLCFDVNGPECTLSGDGEILLSRLRKDNDSGGSPSTSLLIESCTVYLSWSASASLYNNGSAGAGTQRSFHITIAADAAVYAAGDVSIDGVTGNTVAWNDGSITVYGHLEVSNNLMLRTGNPAAGSIHYEVHGSMVVEGEVLGAQTVSSGQAIAYLQLHPTASMDLLGAGAVFSQLSGIREEVTLAAGSELVYDQAAVQVVEGSFEYSNLTLRGGGDKHLSSPGNVNGTLLLENGKLILGANDLTLSASASMIGGTASSYIQTNSSGRLWQTVSAPTLFPVGNSSYNPAVLARSTGAGSHGVRVFDLVLTEGLSGIPLFELVVQRTWDLSGFLGGSTLELTVQWNADEERPGFTRSACYLSQHLNGNWESMPAAAALGSDPYTFTRSAIVGLPSAFAMGSQSALPVQLLSFRALKSQAFALLEWETGWERNHAYFAIERSSDGKHFERIGTLAQRGEQQQSASYTWTDGSPLPGWNYYRLKQVDLNGTFEYSEVKTLQFPPIQSKLQVHPNPVQDILYVSREQWGESPEMIFLYDIRGQIRAAFAVDHAGSGIEIPLSSLPEGVYFLKVSNESIRIVKQ